MYGTRLAPKIPEGGHFCRGVGDKQSVAGYLRGRSDQTLVQPDSRLLLWQAGWAEEEPQVMFDADLAANSAAAKQLQ